MYSDKYKLILGSKSPRRSQLLDHAGFSYEKRVIETDENYPSDLPIPDVAEYIARAKAAAHKGKLASDELLLTADTIVVYENKVYGKPRSEQEAIDTILLMENRVHLVYSGVCLMTNENLSSFTELSEVKFGHITENEAKTYVEKFKPLDKAGSYGIQDWIGFVRIEWIKGSYTNILGLPLSQTYDRLVNSSYK